jgi:hypothetical protein
MDLEKARERLRAAYKKIEDERKAKQIRFIPLEKVAKLGQGRPTAPSSKNAMCQALCLTGKKCTFRATSPCGKFCRKHIIVDDGQSCSFINDGVPCAQPTCA